MNLLAFETATEACRSPCLIDGEVRERFELAPRRHAELALPWAEQLLAEAGIARSQLDAIAVGRGPGASPACDSPSRWRRASRWRWTGRWCRCPRWRRWPCAPPAPLPPAGEGWGEGKRVLTAIDARMGEVYTAAFVLRPDGVHALSGEAVMVPDQVDLPDDENGWLGVGTGFAAADGVLAQRLASRFSSIDATACRTPPMSRVWPPAPMHSARRCLPTRSSRPICATTWP